MIHNKYNIDLLSKYHKKEHDNYSDWLDRKFKTKINHAKDKVIS